MKPLRSKVVRHGITYRVVIRAPGPGADLRMYCADKWIGCGRVEDYPKCKITGGVRKAYGPHMWEILDKLGKRLTKKALARIEKREAKRKAKKHG